MKILVITVLPALIIAFWLAGEKNQIQSKDPQDEELVLSQTRNKVTGELLNIKMIRCRVCGQTIYYGEFSLEGKPRMAYTNQHICGKYGNKTVKYQGMGVGLPDIDIFEWLEEKQRRLKIKP